ncbi:MAG: hypothetical protein ACK53Y_22700, partial [bacterium]
TVILTSIARSVQSSLGDGKFFFSTTTYGGAYVVVVLFVCLLFVCPRNYLNNVQDIIKYISVN